MAPSLLSAGGGYYYGDFEDLTRRSRSRSPYVKIEELDSNDAVISRKNYSYTASGPLTLYQGLRYTTPASYVSPSSLLTHDYAHDTYPYTLSSSPLWGNSLWNNSLYPWTGLRTHYPAWNDMSYYLARLLPYYYHTRPVRHTTYAPHYHYNYETPRTRVTRSTRTYHYPAIMPSYNYSYALTSSGYLN